MGAFTSTTFPHASHFLNNVGLGFDLGEFYGGEARSTNITIKRCLRTGTNVDLDLLPDLGDPQVQRYALTYLATNQVLVLIMAPNCRCRGPTSHLDAVVHQDTWEHVEFWGHADLRQIAHSRYSFLAHTSPCRIWKVPPWPEVWLHPTVDSGKLDRCMTDQSDTTAFLLRSQPR